MSISPVAFEEANGSLVAPRDFDEECGSLPCYRDGKQVISCWSLSWRDRLKLLFTGRLWLGVAGGSSAPPVWLDVDRPFGEG